jgi:hypothetical protein
VNIIRHTTKRSLTAAATQVVVQSLSGIALLLGTVGISAGQNAITEWNEIGVTTALNGNLLISPGSNTSGGTGIYLAYVHLAMYNAVNAIRHRYETYGGPPVPAPEGSKPEAAAIAAAYYTLKNYFPDQSTTLAEKYSQALSAIPAGPPRDRGVLVGNAAALQLISMRSGDGRGAAVPYAYPAAPVAGVWIPTPPAFALPQTPWVSQMAPFTMKSTSQFLPAEGPPPLWSQQWADDFNQVQALGAVNSTVRSAEQTDIGRFWTDQTSKQYARALRDLAVARKLDLSESARLFAMVWPGFADAFIGCMNAKYHFSFWRPVTAIRNGDIDGNAATIADPAWTPLGATPNHPEYPAAHGCVTGSVAHVLNGFFRTRNFAFSAASDIANLNQPVRKYNSTTALENEVFVARIYAGFHYHHSLIQGFLLGHSVADQLVAKFFRRVHGDGEKSDDDDRSDNEK